MPFPHDYDYPTVALCFYRFNSNPTVLSGTSHVSARARHRNFNSVSGVGETSGERAYEKHAVMWGRERSKNGVPIAKSKPQMVIVMDLSS
jgi:hypothetical protein